MFREKIKSVGISILGGNSGVEGKYELGIDSIRVVNEEDVAHTPISRLFASSRGPLVLNSIISLLQKLKITRRHETCKSELTFNSSWLCSFFLFYLNSIYNVNKKCSKCNVYKITNKDAAGKVSYQLVKEKSGLKFDKRQRRGRKRR